MRNDGYARAAVLGMGGSSLAPEVFSRTFGAGGATRDGLELRILDSTHPDAVRGFKEWAQSARTIFCVSSKSGSTTEPNAFHAAMSDFAPALDFIAITDPGSSLAELARAQEFRSIVEGPPDVGGRYSALSVFGLVPGRAGRRGPAPRCWIARWPWPRPAGGPRSRIPACGWAPPSARPPWRAATSSPSSPHAGWRASVTGPSS